MKHTLHKKRWMIIVLPVLLAAILLGGLFFYGAAQNEHTKAQMLAPLEAYVQARASVLTRTFEGNFEALHTLAVAAGGGTIPEQGLHSMQINGFLSATDFESVYFIHADGSFSGHVNTDANVADRAYFIEAMQGKDTMTMVHVDRVLGGRRFIFAVPVYAQSEIIGIIAGSVREEALRGILDEADPASEQYVYLCDENGEILIGSNNINALCKTQIWELVDTQAVLGDGQTVAQAFKTGSTGRAHFDFGGDGRYMVYCPLGINGYMLAGLLTNEAMNAAQWNALWPGLVAFGSLLMIVVAIYVVMMALAVRRNNELHSQKEDLSQSMGSLEQSEERYRIIEEFTDSAIFDGNFERNELRFNQGYYRMTGHDPIVRKISDILGPIPYIHKEDQELFSKFAQALYTGKPYNSVEYRAQNADGTWVWHRAEYRTLFDADNRAQRCVGRIINVDAYRKTVEELSALAQRDSLTGLLNHENMIRQADAFLQGEGADGLHAIMMIDLDSFKTLNDRFGHYEGDGVLATIGHELKALFKPNDIVGRIGGDEFLVLVKNIATEQFAQLKAREVLESLQYTHGKGKESISLSCCVGITLYNGDHKEMSVLYLEADAALYRAKAQGSNRYMFFDSIQRGDGEEQLPMLPTELSEVNNSTVQLRALLEHIDGGVLLYEVGEQIKTLYVSPSYYNMDGALPVEQLKRAEGSVIELEGIVCRDDLEPLRQILRNGAQSGKPFSAVYRVYRDNSIGYGWHHMKAVRIPYEGSELPVLIVILTDITEMKQREEELYLSNERTRFALRQMSSSVWEIDVPQDRFRVWDINKQAYKEQFTLTHLPESAIQSAAVHPNSVDDFKGFYAAIRAGEPEGNVALLIRIGDHKTYTWYKLSFYMLYDMHHAPLKAVGIAEPLRNIIDEKQRFMQEDVLRETVADKVMATIKVNLTQNKVVSAVVNMKAPFDTASLTTYDQLTNALSRLLFDEEDKHIFDARMSIKALKEAYERGSYWITAQFRCMDENGNIRWLCNDASMIREPISGDVFLFAYLRNIDTLKRIELALPSRAEFDMTTALYNKETTQELVRCALRRTVGLNTLCAMIVVDIKGIDEISNEMGRNIGRRALFALSRIIRVVLGASSVIGHISEKRLLAFMPDVENANRVTEQLRELNELIGKQDIVAQTKGKLYLNYGVTVCQAEKANVSILLEQAAYACEHGTAVADGRISVYNEYAARHNDGAPLPAALDRIIPQNAGRQLNAVETEAFSACLMELVSRNDLDMAMYKVLEILGEHYGVARAYMLYLSEDGALLMSGQEWRADAAPLIAPLPFNAPLSEYPALAQAMQTDGVVSGQDTAVQEQMLIAPIRRDDKVKGFLCLEQPTLNIEKTALLQTVAPLLEMEREKRSDPWCEGLGKARDVLTGLGNRNGYENYLRSITVDALSSLGLLLVTVNDMTQICYNHGNDFGNRLLVAASGILRGEFGAQEVYRYSGDTFTAVCQNLTYEAFVGKVERARKALEADYPTVFSLGYAWGDREISVEKLKLNAETMLSDAQQEFMRREIREGRREEPEIMRNLRRMIEEKWFKVYLQPKADVASGQIVGAEALVRLLDPQKGMISPGAFIGVLEKENMIRYLDMYMLEQTVQLIRHWMDIGLKPIPVSVNYSRTTMIHPGMLNYTLETLERYKVPKELIEVEITESVGNLERAMVKEACVSFTNSGIKLSLDDYGSEYSSLAVLSSIHFDVVKVDRSITNSIATSNISRFIMESTVWLCAEMGAVCLAEGVETQEQLDALKDFGCALAQGYLFNKPLPAEEFTVKYLRA